MEDSIPNLPSTLSDDGSNNSRASDAAQIQNETAPRRNEAALTLIHQFHNEANATRAAMGVVLDKPIVPPDYFRNLFPDISRFSIALDAIPDFSLKLKGFDSLAEDIRKKCNAISFAMKQFLEGATSESLKQVSLGLLENRMEPFKTGRIIDASAVIRMRSSVIVSDAQIIQPANAETIIFGPPRANIIASDFGHGSESASIEIIPAGVDGASLPPITGHLYITQEDHQLLATGTLTTTVIRQRRSIDAWVGAFTAPLQAPVKTILDRLAAHRKGIPLPGLRRCEYKIRRSSSECVVILADGVFIASVTYANGRLITSFQSFALTHRPDLMQSDCLEVWNDIERHLILAEYGILMADSSVPALLASAQTTSQASTMGLPTDPNDPRLTESGMNEDHRRIVAMTNQGKSPRQIHDIEQRFGKGYIDGVLHDVRHHHSRAHLVKPAQSRQKKSKSESK